MKASRIISAMIMFVIIFASSAHSEQLWNAYQVVPITQCELESGVVSVNATAQTGPGTALYYPDANTVRILFVTDDIPDVGHSTYDMYYVDYDLTTGTFSMARDIDLVCTDPINTSGEEQNPYVSEDGRWLFYITLGAGGASDHEIWVAEMDGSGQWSNPHKLPTTINDDNDEHLGCMHGGKFYWTANNRDGAGTAFDIWSADVDMETETFTNIEKIVFPAPWDNTVDEVEPFITSDGQYMYFSAQGDIYYSEWTDLGGSMGWGYPVVLESTINGPTSDRCPSVTLDNRLFFFTKVTTTNKLCYAENARDIYNLIARDVPMDQGGKIHLQWNASFVDTIPNTEITHYSAWRRIDKLTSVPVGSIEMVSELDIPIDFDDKAIRRPTLGDGYAWEWLANVPASYFETYALLVTSLYDSMGTDPNLQYFMVTAHTGSPLVYYDSDVAAGYSVDNLAPAMVSGFMSSAVDIITWDDNHESDLLGYVLYGSKDEGATYEILETVFTAECDLKPHVAENYYYYEIAAIDIHGNESTKINFVSELQTPAETPAITSLCQNFPNPFNPVTRISFTLGKAEFVTLNVYDVTGRLINTLIDARMMVQGPHEVQWNAIDSMGNPVASGVYFYRLNSGDFTETKKMILLR